jgi:hypothetical protein
VNSTRQGATKQVTEIVDVFQLFFNREFVGKIIVESNRYVEQFLRGRKLCRMSHTRARKPVTEGEIYFVLGLFMLMGIIKKLP